MPENYLNIRTAPDYGAGCCAGSCENFPIAPVDVPAGPDRCPAPADGGQIVCRHFAASQMGPADFFYETKKEDFYLPQYVL